MTIATPPLNTTGGASTIPDKPPLRLVLVRGMGAIGDNLYRLHQPAAALARLEGVEVFRLIHQRRQLGRRSLCEVNDYLPDVQAWNSAHASWSDRRALFCFDQLIPPLRCHPGDSFASRMGAGLCAATGLEELIGPTPEAYRQRAIALGRQPAELARLRQQLLERKGELPLFNTAAWVGHLEALVEKLLAEVGR